MVGERGGVCEGGVVVGERGGVCEGVVVVGEKGGVCEGVWWWERGEEFVRGCGGGREGRSL